MCAVPKRTSTDNSEELCIASFPILSFLFSSRLHTGRSISLQTGRLRLPLSVVASLAMATRLPGVPLWRCHWEDSIPLLVRPPPTIPLLDRTLRTCRSSALKAVSSEQDRGPSAPKRHCCHKGCRPSKRVRGASRAPLEADPLPQGAMPRELRYPADSRSGPARVSCLSPYGTPTATRPEIHQEPRSACRLRGLAIWSPNASLKLSPTCAPCTIAWKSAFSKYDLVNLEVGPHPSKTDAQSNGAAK